MGQAHLLKVVAELAGQGGWAGQVSMSQRQQQQSAVQQAVRQVDGPRSSLLWSSTTYTGGRRGRVRMNWHKAQAPQSQGLPNQGWTVAAESHWADGGQPFIYTVAAVRRKGGLAPQLLSLPPPKDFYPCRDKMASHEGRDISCLARVG